ncbi:hypothetical protein AYO38_09845 [bacterium SCGC AG-212-C10]|nr:hypothetical protein AYO38_09845 [bacterium SCGC AG-212-C10]
MPGHTFASLDAECVRAISTLFAVEARIEPYSPDGMPVYALDLAGAADGIRLILWPSLNRVDVRRASDHSWVLKNVGGIDIIAGVEVVFRPAEGRGFLFVSVNGFVNMVMG